MDEIISTYDEYKNSYNSRLSSYLNDYIDYNETTFLSSELEKYTDYYKSLDINKIPKNTLTSLNQIIEFISKQLSISRSPNPFATAIYTQGELPRVLTKQKPYTPEKQKGGKVKGEDKSDKKEEPKDTAENDYTKSTIEDCLYSIKDDINPDQYESLVDALYYYFKTGKFPKLGKKIMFKSVNKKKVGWALKEAYKNNTIKKLDIEYFRFAKDNINLFSEEVIVEDKFRKSKFYKLFTTNPDK